MFTPSSKCEIQASGIPRLYPHYPDSFLYPGHLSVLFNSGSAFPSICDDQLIAPINASLTMDCTGYFTPRPTQQMDDSPNQNESSQDLIATHGDDEKKPASDDEDENSCSLQHLRLIGEQSETSSTQNSRTGESSSLSFVGSAMVKQLVPRTHDTHKLQLPVAYEKVFADRSTCGNLFVLPRELRDEVYRLVLAGPGIFRLFYRRVAPPCSMKTCPRYEDPLGALDGSNNNERGSSDQRVTCPSLFLINSFVKAETQPIFYKLNHFIFRSDCIHAPFLPSPEALLENVETIEIFLTNREVDVTQPAMEPIPSKLKLTFRPDENAHVYEEDNEEYMEMLRPASQSLYDAWQGVIEKVIGMPRLKAVLFNDSACYLVDQSTKDPDWILLMIQKALRDRNEKGLPDVEVGLGPE